MFAWALHSRRFRSLGSIFLPWWRSWRRLTFGRQDDNGGRWWRRRRRHWLLLYIFSINRAEIFTTWLWLLKLVSKMFLLFDWRIFELFFLWFSWMKRFICLQFRLKSNLIEKSLEQRGKDSPALVFVFLSLLLLNFLGNYIMAWMKGGCDLLEQTTRQDRSYDESG